MDLLSELLSSYYIVRKYFYLDLSLSFLIKQNFFCKTSIFVFHKKTRMQPFCLSRPRVSKVRIVKNLSLFLHRVHIHTVQTKSTQFKSKSVHKGRWLHLLVNSALWAFNVLKEAFSWSVTLSKSVQNTIGFFYCVRCWEVTRIRNLNEEAILRSLGKIGKW